MRKATRIVSGYGRRVLAALAGDRVASSEPLRGSLRVVFLGQVAVSGAHVLRRPAGAVRPTFIDVRAGTNPAGVRALVARAAPHIVVVLAPEVVGEDMLTGIRAATLGVARPGAPSPDPRRFDRVLAAPGTGVAGAWRTRPLPVDDRLFAPIRTPRDPPRALFLGRSTEHREDLLLASKHGHDVLHYAHGLTGEALTAVLDTADIGIALNHSDAPGVPTQALVHLAAGQLLLSERLTPPCGLEAGIDFLEFDSRDALATLLYQLRARPDAYDRVRIRGRLKAESHRASVVWPRIAADLLWDLAAFGSEREGSGTLPDTLTR